MSITSKGQECSPEPSIIEVLICNDESILIAESVSRRPESDLTAFYVFRNEERIFTQQYSTSHQIRFDTNGEPGIYRVLSFLRSSDGKIVSKYSSPIFLNPRKISLIHPRKLQTEDRALQFEEASWKFSAVYFAGKCSKLFVMTTAAVERSKMTLPNFNRWTWAGAGKYPGHVLCVADPTLDLNEDMKLGWYLGTESHDATDALCKLILQCADALGISKDQIVFWGSSGGGFAALSLASRIEGTTAVAINAQTDIFAYESKRVVEMVRKVCFGDHSAEEIKQRFSYRVDMSNAWKNNQSSKIIFIQNKLDAHHYNYHFQPLWRSLGGNAEGGRAKNGRYFAWLYEDARGHGPESEQMLPEIFRLIDAGIGMTSSAMQANDQLLM